MLFLGVTKDKSKKEDLLKEIQKHLKEIANSLNLLSKEKDLLNEEVKIYFEFTSENFEKVRLAYKQVIQGRLDLAKAFLEEVDW